MRGKLRAFALVLLAVLVLLTGCSVPAAVQEIAELPLAETVPDETAAAETVVETAPEEMADAQADTEIYPEQDESNTVPMGLPGQENLGKTWQEVVDTVRMSFGENADISQNCSVENKTTEDGMAYTEGIITGVPQGEEMITADQYYYLLDSKVAALVYKFILSDSSVFVAGCILSDSHTSRETMRVIRPSPSATSRWTFCIAIHPSGRTCLRYSQSAI